MSSLQRIIKYVGIALAVLLTVGIIGSICAVVFGLTGTAKRSGSSVDAVSQVYDIGEFNSIDLDGGVSDIWIQVGDQYQVETVDVPDTMSVKVKSNGTLSIEDNSESHWFDWLDQDTWNKSSKIYITVPYDYEAEKIVISGGTGDIRIDDVKSKNFNFDGGVGDIKGSNLYFDKVKINVGVGNVDLDAVEFGSCNIDGGVGDINISGVIDGDCELDAGVGNIDLDLAKSQEDYNLDIDTGVGTIRLNGKKADDLKESGGDKPRLRIDGGVGNVDLDFEED